MFNIGTLCLLDALHRNMFTQHLLHNSSTYWMFMKSWVHTTQSIFVLWAVNLIFGHVPDSCKAMKARGSFRHFLQPIPGTTPRHLWVSASPGAILHHLLTWFLARTQATTANSGLSFTHVPNPSKGPANKSWQFSKCQVNSKWNLTTKASGAPGQGFSWPSPHLVGRNLFISEVCCYLMLPDQTLGSCIVTAHTSF